MIKLVNEFGAITQVKLPVPYPLSYVNSYLISGSNGYTLLDPGLNTDDARRVWTRVLKERKINYTDIEKIVLTHHHPDHYGLAGWFQEQAQAPVYMSSLAHQQAKLMWGEQAKAMNEAVVALFRRHGLVARHEGNMLTHLESFLSLVHPQPEVTYIHEHEQVRLGDESFEVIMAHGHALGQLCFYQPESKLLFCGDQVLPDITPNVSYLPQMDEDPLASFYSSLHELGALNVSVAYPGHRQPLSHFAERISEIIKHHDERLQQIQTLLATERTVYDLCIQLFGDRLSTHQLRFAMAEVLAHAIYLERQGSIRQFEKGGTIVFHQ